MSSLWGKMWSESAFVPANGKSTPDSGDRITQLERRVQVLENRLNKLVKI